MAIKSTTTYICDGCGARADNHDGWRVLTPVFQTTNGFQGDARGGGELLCPDCVAKALGRSAKR